MLVKNNARTILRGPKNKKNINFGFLDGGGGWHPGNQSLCLIMRVKINENGVFLGFSMF